MKVLALFGFILMSASSFSLTGDGTNIPLDSRSSAQNDQYAMKLKIHELHCSHNNSVKPEDINTFSVYKNILQSGVKMSVQITESVVDKANTGSARKLALQCKNARMQAIEDNSDVIVNLKTGEVFPEKGFLVIRQPIELERQQQ